MTWIQQILDAPGGKVGVALIGAIGALLVAVITAISTLLVVIVTNYLTRRREDRTKRIQLTIEHAERQLREFYSPLLALAMRLDQSAEGSEEIVPKAQITERPDIDRIMWEDIYSPIHEQIISILKTKIHLIEGFDIERAEGFKAYLLHYETQKIQWQLNAKGHVIPGVKIPPYPPLFNEDIKRGLSKVSSRYEDSLRELRGSKRRNQPPKKSYVHKPSIF
jgi:hypothetical protein